MAVLRVLAIGPPLPSMPESFFFPVGNSSLTQEQYTGGTPVPLSLLRHVNDVAVPQPEVVLWGIAVHDPFHRLVRLGIMTRDLHMREIRRDANQFRIIQHRA